MNKREKNKTHKQKKTAATKSKTTTATNSTTRQRQQHQATRFADNIFVWCLCFLLNC
jgi:BRCT domain type II-containing protein